MKKFVILDGSSLMYRAFYALPLLTSSSGVYTNAVLGFSNMLLKIFQDLDPDYLVIAFDKGKKTFRNELFPDYKGTRKKTPEELSAQIPLLHEMAEALGIILVEKEGYEADDIIGTLSTEAARAGHQAIVVTGDRDALQLVRPGVRVMLTKKGISDMADYDEAAFREEYGLEPLRLIDLKGLMGDTSDNIPGVPGVGPKTAIKLLQTYGSLEAVLSNTGEVSGKKLRENLENNREQAILSKRLATIDCGVPDISIDFDSYTVHPDAAKLADFCGRYELNSMAKKWNKYMTGSEATAVEPETVALPDFKLISKETELASIAAASELGIAVAFSDGGKDPFCRLSGIAVSVLPQEEIFCMTADEPGFPKLLELLQDGRRVYALELKQLYHGGITEIGSFAGLEFAGYLLYPEQTDYRLETLLKKEMPEISLTEGKSDPMARMAAEAFAIGRLGRKLFGKLEQEQLMTLHDDMERPLVPVLAKMEQRGVYVNRERLAEKSHEIGLRLSSIEEDIYTLAGGEFNINSPKQLGEILFERLGLPASKKTKTGYSTNVEVLEGLRFKHPIIESILSYRTLAKLKSTYLDSLEELISRETGRVHTSFNQTVTATGRLSSSNPNLQNIPVRTDEGKQIRALFEPGEGYDALLSADYSQIELRLLAHMSGDESFIDAFRQGQDVHARTAAEVFGVPLDAVGAELRRKAKAVNFGIVYGISDYGLSRDLHISRKEAGEYIRLYFERYPGVKNFLDETVKKAHETGYVTTMFGRRRALPAIHSSNYNQRMLAERMAMNTPIQGSAADIIKLAMISANDKLEKAGVKSRILLQVHDELVLEAVSVEIEQVSAILKEAMENVVELSVPLIIDIHSGKDWAEAK